MDADSPASRRVAPELRRSDMMSTKFDDAVGFEGDRWRGGNARTEMAQRAFQLGSTARTQLFISGNPITKTEACRWIGLGIELTVIDIATNRPIDQKVGPVAVAGPQWTGVATLIGGLVFRIE